MASHQLQRKLLLQQRVARLDDAREHAVTEAVGWPRAYLHARCGHDCLGCCKDPEHILVGAGFGAHNLVMKCGACSAVWVWCGVVQCG